MQNKQIVIEYSDYSSIQDLPTDARILMEKAIAATGTAYAPYSRFHVGAAVQLADATIVSGSNQENIAYPSGLCAERTALFSASAQHPGQPVTAIAIAGRNTDGNLTEASPCGACRQVLAEYETRYNNPITVYTYLNGGRIRRVKGVKNLLPFIFNAEL